jgi:HTH-type transcriptional regulator/antitoxin HigA
MPVRNEAGPPPPGETGCAPPPGDTLRELLQERGMTQRDLARRAGLSPQHVNRLVQGLVPLSAEIARRLELVTGTPARLWNRLEADYRSDLERLRSQRDLAAGAWWLARMPVRELADRGVLPAEPQDMASRVEQLLRFFGVASVQAWDDVYGNLAGSSGQSRAHDVQAGAVAAWLRLGEIAAQDVPCEPYDRAGLRAAVPGLRALTAEPLARSRPQLRRACAEHGVAVVFVKELSGAQASVTRWLTPVKALIQLSFQYRRTDDELWSAFFHEMHHVLRRGRDGVLTEVSQAGTRDPREAEADQFSRDLLIPPRAARGLPALGSATAVCDFAWQLGVGPGIVVGRLQHDGLWPASRGNDLKRRFKLAGAG